MESAQVDRKAICLPKPSATHPADVRIVTGVGTHVAGQLNRLCKDGRAILAGIHLPCREREKAGEVGYLERSSAPGETLLL